MFFSTAATQGEDFAQQISFTNLRSLTFTDGFDKSLEQILPQKLEKLSLGNDFNQILDQTELPNNLESLSFGDEFNQNLDAVNLPGTLEELSFGRRFDQSLVDVRLPDSLKSLTFGSYYNQSLENVHLPLSLEHLTFGDRFNQSLEYVSLPSNLQSLHFGMHFSRNLEGITWPSNLRSFSCGRQYKESLSLGFVESHRCFYKRYNLFSSKKKNTSSQLAGQGGSRRCIVLSIFFLFGKCDFCLSWSHCAQMEPLGSLIFVFNSPSPTTRYYQTPCFEPRNPYRPFKMTYPP